MAAPVIGYINQFVTGPFARMMLEGVQSALAAQDARLITFGTSPAETATAQLAHDLVDGWIVLPGEDIQKLVELGKPVTTIAAPLPESPCTSVVSDNQGSAQAVIEHLLEHGHTRIAYVAVMQNLDFQERYRGYCAALLAHGISPDPQLLIDPGAYTNEHVLAAFNQAQAQQVAFTACFCANDTLASGALKALQANGLRVPDDVAVIGFDDLEEAQYYSPPLTTVRQRIDLMAAAAVESLLRRIATGNTAPETIMVPTVLVVRESCGCRSSLGLGVPVAATQIWQQRVKQALLSYALFPLVLPTDWVAEAIWPGLDTVVDALAATIAGSSAVTPDLQRAWQSAARFTTDLERLYRMGEIMQTIALEQFDAHQSSPAMRARVAAFVAQAQLGMIRANYQNSATLSITYRDLFFAENHVLERLLKDGMIDLDDLDWMFPTSVRWAFLSLWEAGATSLRVRSSFFRDSTLLPAGISVAATAFPPIAIIPPAHEVEFIKAVPIRTKTRNWGVLTYSMPLVASDYDAAALWPALMGMALDQRQLLASLNDSQATLRTAYEQARALSDTVRELGCPLIPLLPGVLLVPLIGAIDELRSRQIIDQVLNGVAEARAHRVLLDITGVPLVDTQVAGTLIQMARAVGLLGARVTLVGVRPEIAQSIVSLGVELSLIETRPTLASALQALIKRGP